MKKFLNTLTNNQPGILIKPLILEFLKSFLQGQPFLVIMFVLLQLLKPLENSGNHLDFTRLIGLTIWLALSMLLLFAFSKAVYVAEHSAAYKIGSDGRLNLGEYLRKLSMGFFKGRDPGDITALMLQDYSNIETMISHLLMGAVGALATPLIFLFFLFPFDWRMTLITLSPIPLAIVAALISRVIVNKAGDKHMGE
ncbi:MAG: ABC transporter ATP-binding protein, partial [Proteobacteria bacterium]|nr:ABC transporter ATP-binding protein [Pseudomonadota bacterium]